MVTGRANHAKLETTSGWEGPSQSVQRSGRRSRWGRLTCRFMVSSPIRGQHELTRKYTLYCGIPHFRRWHHCKQLQPTSCLFLYGTLLHLSTRDSSGKLTKFPILSFNKKDNDQMIEQLASIPDLRGAWGNSRKIPQEPQCRLFSPFCKWVKQSFADKADDACPSRYHIMCWQPPAPPPQSNGHPPWALSAAPGQASGDLGIRELAWGDSVISGGHASILGTHRLLAMIA